MSKRETIKTKPKVIIDYWIGKVDECRLSVDWAEADTHCWRCGCQASLERCHIVPDALGGKDEPSNLVLLCKRCHADGPNVDDPEIMWDWIRAYGVPFYETFWKIVGSKEYEFIYGASVGDDLREILDRADVSIEEKEIENLLKSSIQNAMNKANIHFGQPYLNTATIAGIYRMMLKKIANELDVKFPIKTERNNPWWAKYLGFN